MSKDFSGQNLRGRSFKGQDLEGADFSNADIRGTNFTDANLKGAKFTRAKADLEWKISWIVVLIALITVSFAIAAALLLVHDIIFAFFTFIVIFYFIKKNGRNSIAVIQKITVYFFTGGRVTGTTFYHADLTDADFTGATLKNADFKKAKLTRTNFFYTEQLELSRVKDTILAQRNVLSLLVTGNGRGKSYAGANLRGANLQDADLKSANLKNADIREATFQRANLEGANLAQTEAMETDFTRISHKILKKRGQKLPKCILHNNPSSLKYDPN